MLGALNVVVTSRGLCCQQSAVLPAAACARGRRQHPLGLLWLLITLNVHTNDSLLLFLPTGSLWMLRTQNRTGTCQKSVTVSPLLF